MRATLVFEQPTLQYGWSWSLFRSSEDYSTVLTQALSLVDAIRACLTSETYCRFVRVSDDAVDGDADIQDLGTTKPGTHEGNSVDPCTAMLWRLDEETFRVHGFKFLHGLPLSAFTALVPSAAFLADATTLALQSALTEGWQFAARRRGEGGAKQLWPIFNDYPRRMTCRKVGRPFAYFRGRRATC